MEKHISKFASFREAEEADNAYYRSLTPVQRMDILFGLTDFGCSNENEAQPRLERVYRIVELSQS